MEKSLPMARRSRSGKTPWCWGSISVPRMNPVSASPAAPQERTMLDVLDVHTYYRDSYVLQGVSLGLQEGQVVVVLGRNGAGKTTLIRSIMGFTRPRRGQVVFEGHAINGLPAHQIAKLGIGIVPQGRRVFGTLSVRENLEIAARSSGESDSAWNLEAILDRFPRLSERLSQRAGKLSGGEQQMLACGR